MIRTLNKKVPLIAALSSVQLFSTPVFSKQRSPQEKIRTHITLEEIIIGAMQNAATAQQIKLQGLSGEIGEVRSKAALDLNLFSNVSLSQSSAESLSASSPKASESTSITLGTSKYFSTGTTLSASVTAAETNQRFSSPIGEVDANSANISFSLKQALLRDSFGSGTRSNLNSAKLFKIASEQEIKTKLEEFATSISEVYFNTRKSQLTVLASKNNQASQKKLLDISKLLNKRGNLEKSDYLQIETSYLNAVEQTSEAEKNLDNIWNSSITLLGLPKIYKTVPARQITLNFTDRSGMAKALCRSPSSILLERTSGYQHAKNLLASAEESLSANKNLALPSLDLEFKHTADNIDDDTSTALDDSLTGKHSGTQVILSLQAPLFNYGNKANAFDKARQHQLAKITFDNYKEDLLTEIENACNSFARSDKKVSSTTKMYKLAKQRDKLDIKRFELGRTDAFSAIQSSIAKTSAWLNMEFSKLDVQIHAWKVLKLTGNIESSLKSN